MKTSQVISRECAARVLRATLLPAVLLLTLFGGAPATAASLFYEDFEGFSSFPDTDNNGHQINPGLPLQAEGATEKWYGGRFEWPDNGTIDSDLAVNRFGGGSNNTHVGRAEDEAGMLFKVSTTGLTTATLSFDWKFFSSENWDSLKVGYYVGEINFGASRYYDFVADSFFNPLPNTPDVNNEGWTTRWTQLMAGNENSNWQHEQFALPVGQQTVWIALWLNGNECDYGKFDNVCVTGNIPVPEPASVLMAAVGAGLCGCVALRRRFTVQARLRAQKTN
jgi:hypothetical protein